MDSRIITLQFAFFLKDIVGRPDLEFADLNSNMLNTFNGMPQILPIPKELPTDVPVMILRSDDNEYICNISRSRIDFICKRINDSKSNIDLLQDFNLKVAGITKYLLNKQEVIRFGMIARYFFKDNEAVSILQRKYFKNTVDDAIELSLRYNKKSSEYGYEINDVLEISAVEMVVNNRPEKGILIQRDINNVPNHEKIFNFDTLSKLSQKYAHKIGELEIESLIR